MRRFHRFSWMIFLVAGACIEPYDYPFEEQTNYLVVESAITSDMGPHKVTLTTTRNIKNKENIFKLRVQGARVTISNSSGGTERLVEADTSGIYYTSADYKGEIGEKYLLRIVLEDGKEYVSDSVEMVPLPEIDSIGISYGSQKYLSSENSLFTQTGFFINGYFDDEPSIKNAYLINWDYTYKVFTHPEQANFYDDEGCECWVPAPKDCCAVCWVEEDVPDFSVVNDKISNGSSLTQYDLFFLPVVGKMLYEKIYLGVTVQSLTPDAYLFWKTVYDSRYNQGGLFDPTPNTVKANVRNVADEQELVLGYFYASDVRRVHRYIYPRDFPERIDTDTGYSDSCTLLENSTAEKPDYWKE